MITWILFGGFAFLGAVCVRLCMMLDDTDRDNAMLRREIEQWHEAYQAGKLRR